MARTEATVAEADKPVVTGYAVALTVAERARGLEAWMAAAPTLTEA